MPQQRPKKGQTPINSDAFNLVPDLATINDTSGVVVSVADRTEADSIASALATAGWPVTDARPLYVWNQSTNSLEVKVTAGWKGGVKPFGHMGKTNGFTAGTDQNPVSGMAAQILRGGMTFSSADNALVVPLTGYYRLSGRTYSSGASTGGSLWQITINGVTAGFGASVWWTKTQVDEFVPLTTVVRQLTAGDKLALRAQQPASTWGSDGYNGCFIEVEFMDQW